MTVMLKGNRRVQNPPKRQKGSSVPAGESGKGTREKASLSWELKHKEMLTDWTGGGQQGNKEQSHARRQALNSWNDPEHIPELLWPVRDSSGLS